MFDGKRGVPRDSSEGQGLPEARLCQVLQDHCGRKQHRVFCRDHQSLDPARDMFNHKPRSHPTMSNRIFMCLKLGVQMRKAMARRQSWAVQQLPYQRPLWKSTAWLAGVPAYLRELTSRENLPSSAQGTSFTLITSALGRFPK